MIAPTLITLGAILVTYKIAPWQEVHGEKAKQAEEAERLSKHAPLDVRIEESWSNDTDVIWLFDQPLTSADIATFNNTPITPFEGIENFADARDGIRVGNYCGSSVCDGSQTRFKLRVTGHRQRPVQITAMSARILEESLPPRGAFIQGPTGGLDDVHPGLVILDSGDLRLHTMNQDGSPGRPLLDEKYVYVERGEPVVFEVFAVSRTSDYRWELVLETLVDGKTQEMVVRSDGSAKGQPFRTPGKLYDPSAYDVSGECALLMTPNPMCSAKRNG